MLFKNVVKKRSDIRTKLLFYVVLSYILGIGIKRAYG
nr:MAG TPA: hypothetical protein [Bacteriophage sp.]